MMFLYNVLVVSTMFQDLPLRLYIGSYGSSLSGFIAIFVFIYLALTGRIYYTKFFIIFFKLLIYVLISIFVAFVLYMLIHHNLYYYDEHVLIKALKLYSYLLTNYIYAIVVFSISARLTKKQMLSPFPFCLFVSVLISIIEIYYFPYTPPQFRLFHANPDIAYGRIRLLTLESSTTSIIIVLYSLLAIYYYWDINRKKIMLCLSITSAGYLLYISGSKGLLVSFLLAMMLSLFVSKIYLRYKLITIAIGGIFLLILGSDVLTLFENAYHNSTTFTTRLAITLISFCTSIIFPLGVSPVFFLRLAIYGRVVSVDFFETLGSQWSIIINTSELLSQVYQKTDRNIVVGMGPFAYGVYWGIVGNYIFLRSIYRIYKKMIDNLNKRGLFIIQLLVITIFILSLTTVSWDNRYEFWVLIALMNRFSYATNSHIESNIIDANVKAYKKN